MRIPGIVFVAIGIIIAIASYVLYNQGQKMGLFVLIGIAMTVYGALKMYIDRQSEKDEKATSDRAASGAAPASNAPAPRPVRAIDIPRICSNCGARNHARANFCGNCGHRINGY